MIDYEVKIFNRFHSAVSELCAQNRVLSTPLIAPTTFPAVSLYEMDSSTVDHKQTNQFDEDFAEVTYQMDAYAQTKSECRKVFAAGDDALIAMNFSRMSGRVVFQMEDPKVFRMTARYRAMIGKDGMLYRNG